jgi:hypothetical protein
MNPATLINTLPAPITKPSAPFLAVLVEEAPVPLVVVLLATLTAPLDCVESAPAGPDVVAGVTAEETAREIAVVVVPPYATSSLQ